MKIEVNITKTRFFVLLGALLVFSAAIFVYANSYIYPIGTETPAGIYGHSADEVDVDISGQKYGMDATIGEIGKKICLFGVSGESCSGGDADGSYEIKEEFLGVNDKYMESDINHPGIVEIPLIQGTPAYEIYNQSFNTTYNYNQTLFYQINTRNLFDITVILKSSQARFKDMDSFSVGLFPDQRTTNRASEDHTFGKRIVFDIREDAPYNRAKGTDGKWLAVTKAIGNTGTPTIIDTNVSLTMANEWVKFRILHSDDSTVKFYINDREVANVSSAALLPAGNLYLGIINSDEIKLDLIKIILSDLGARFNHQINCENAGVINTINGSGPSYRASFDIPSDCKDNNKGCVLVQTVYDDLTNKVVLNTTPAPLEYNTTNSPVEYRQKAAVSGLGAPWWSTYAGGYSNHYNGDDVPTAIIPEFAVSGISGKIKLFDDSTIPNIETSELKWSVIDNMQNYHSIIYICKY